MEEGRRVGERHWSWGYRVKLEERKREQRRQGVFWGLMPWCATSRRSPCLMPDVIRGSCFTYNSCSSCVKVYCTLILTVYSQRGRKLKHDIDIMRPYRHVFYSYLPMLQWKHCYTCLVTHLMIYFWCVMCVCVQQSGHLFFTASKGETVSWSHKIKGIHLMWLSEWARVCESGYVLGIVDQHETKWQRTV